MRQRPRKFVRLIVPLLVMAVIRRVIRRQRMVLAGQRGSIWERV
jgi:hypothetical protein